MLSLVLSLVLCCALLCRCVFLSKYGEPVVGLFMIALGLAGLLSAWQQQQNKKDEELGSDNYDTTQLSFFLSFFLSA